MPALHMRRVFPRFPAPFSQNQPIANVKHDNRNRATHPVLGIDLITPADSLIVADDELLVSMGSGRFDETDAVLITFAAACFSTPLTSMVTAAPTGRLAGT